MLEREVKEPILVARSRSYCWPQPFSPLKFMIYNFVKFSNLNFKISRLTLSLLLITLLALPSQAISEDAGTSAAQFLKIEVGARNAAMGGTYSGYGNDVFSLWGQPAALASAPDAWSVGFQHTELFQGITQEYVGVAGPLGKRGRIGLTVNTVGVDDLLRTTETATGGLGSVGGTFGARDWALGVHYGLSLSDALSVGAAAKYLRSEIDDVTANSFAVDLGARLRVSQLPGLTIGASVSNMGPGLKFIRVKDDLPIIGRVGAAYDFKVKTNIPVLLAVDVTKASDRDVEAGFGVEYSPLDFLHLRAGYRTPGDDVDEGLTAGFGVTYGGFTLDYGYVPFGVLGDAHRVSAGYVFGGGGGFLPVVADITEVRTENQEPAPSRTPELKPLRRSID